ncbi:rabl3 [Symbiodinium sp. CCMP2592]|nr:rabl3 [Symbiodinium sp. CCMP2592]
MTRPKPLHWLLVGFGTVLVTVRMSQQRLQNMVSDLSQRIPAWNYSGVEEVARGTSESPEVKSVSTTGASSSTSAPDVGRATEEDLACGHLPIDDWDEGQPGELFKVVLLGADAGGGARFGNELFVAAVSLITAVRTARPVLLRRDAIGDTRHTQISQLPCFRSSGHLAPKLLEFCGGCRADRLWEDRSASCNRGRGCFQQLQAKKMILDPGSGGFHQDLSEWRDPPLKWRPLLQQVFHTPMPMLQAPVALPHAADLVMYFRPFRRKQVFDVYNSDGRLSAPPFAFFQWAAEMHRRVEPDGKLWVLADPSLRPHPTVVRLVEELKAEIFIGMDQVPKQAWLGDFVWLRAATKVAISPSTFAWWAAFLGEASKVFVPLLPGQVPMPWCMLFPEDPRYLFYDFWNNESWSEAVPARQRCRDFAKCTEGRCPLKASPEELAKRFYPEVWALESEVAGTGSMSLPGVRVKATKMHSAYRVPKGGTHLRQPRSTVASSFQEGCLQQERPCPEVNFTRSAWYNARKGPKNKEALAKHMECCHAIKRSQKAWARTADLLDGNWYFKHCAFAPLPFEPLAEWLLRAFRRRGEPVEEATEADAKEPERQAEPPAGPASFL